MITDGKKLHLQSVLCFFEATNANVSLNAVYFVAINNCQKSGRKKLLGLLATAVVGKIKKFNCKAILFVGRAQKYIPVSFLYAFCVSLSR